MSRSPFEQHAASARTGVALVVAAAAILSPACQKAPAAAFAMPPAPVVVAAAEARDVALYLDEIGRCVAREMVSVRPQVTGQITAIQFTDGSDLKVGDPLFTIDPRPYQAALATAESRRAKATSALHLARQELERMEKLSDPRAMSERDIDIAKNAVALAESELHASEAAVQTAEIDLERTAIRSPIEGRAGRRLVDLGNIVAANQETVLLVIQRLDPIYADFSVSESDLTAVQQNMAGGNLKVEASLPGDSGPPVAGELTFVDNAVREGTGTVDLRAVLPNSDHRFWPGRFLEIHLHLRTLDDAVLVPAKAPQLSAHGPFVYVVKEDSTAELRAVTPGQRHGDLVVISSGLARGEKVIVEGQLGVMPGGKVRVVEPAAAPGAREAAPSHGASNAAPARGASNAAPANGTNAPASPAGSGQTAPLDGASEPAPGGGTHETRASKTARTGS